MNKNTLLTIALSISILGCVPAVPLPTTPQPTTPVAKANDASKSTTPTPSEISTTQPSTPQPAASVDPSTVDSVSKCTAEGGIALSPIKGVLKTKEGFPIGQATIKIEAVDVENELLKKSFECGSISSLKERVVKDVQSDENGKFETSLVPAGVEYKLTITHPNFRQFTTNITGPNDKENDPNKNTFSFELNESLKIKKLSNMPIGRSGLSAAFIDKKLYLLGGKTTPSNRERDIFSYDFNVFALNEEGRFPLSVNSKAFNSYHGTLVSVDKDLYTIGGDPGVPEVFGVKDVIRLNTQDWSAVSISALERARLTQAVSYKGSILTFGGIEQNESTFKINTSDEIKNINVKTGLVSSVASLPSDRTGMAVISFQDHIYLIGGHSINAEKKVYFKDIIKVDPSSGKSETIGQLPSARTQINGQWGAAANGKLYVLGGIDSNQMKLSDILEINPETGETRKIGDLPTARTNFVVVSFEEKLYVFGGSENINSKETDSSEIIEISNF